MAAKDQHHHLIADACEDYAGQSDGVNDRGCPYVNGQSVENAVSDIEALLAQMGFSLVDEMMAAAAAI